METRVETPRMGSDHPDPNLGRAAALSHGRVLWQSFQVTGSVLALMVVYQVIKYHLNPGMDLITSNVTTIIFSTLLAGCASFFIISRHQALSVKLWREVVHRHGVEQQLREVQGYLEKQVAERTQHLSETNRRLLRLVQERELAEGRLRRSNHDLERKMRELHVLFDTCRRRAVPRDTDQILRDAAATIPRAWEDAYQVGVCITCDGQTFTSQGFDPERVCAALPVPVGERHGCRLEICLGPDLHGLTPQEVVEQHRELLDSLVDFLSKALERKIAQREKQELEGRLAQIQKMEALGNLAGGIAHDFNNVLAGIYGNTELAQMHLARPEKARGYLEGVLNACERGKGLTNQILTFSRRSESEKISLDLAQVTREVIKLVQASLPAGIEVRSSLAKGCQVLADPVQMFQIILNLCNNAVYAMKEKGGVLRVTLASENAQPQGSVTLRVQDAGPGIPHEIMNRIFEPFFTTKPRTEGTGMGLAMAHGIVRGHGGKVSVESRLGFGSTFTVSLPATEAGSKESGKTPGVPVRGQGRLLLVDDEKDQLTITARLLEDLGYRVTEAHDGQDGLNHFMKTPGGFDAVLTDYMMPRMNGGDMARQMLAIRPDLPVVLISGFLDQTTERSISESGVARVAKKPLSLMEVSSLLGEVLSGPGDCGTN